MNCPKCNAVLLMADKHGVEIDYCPVCRGIWLDRGELEKIMEREASVNSQYQNQKHDFDFDDDDDDDKYKKKKYQYSDEDHHKYKKKKGFLHDLFDF